jgi:AcrR family transcriptional regulator
MNLHAPEALRPRKAPRQARSEATVEAIFEATIQVLLAEGMSRLTTARVAVRAGVSVGTMYQYFPHKQALLFAVLQRHLEELVKAMEAACARVAGRSVEEIADGLAAAWVDAKTRRVDVSRALYGVASELDTAELLAGVTDRLGAAVTAVLAGAQGARFTDLGAVSFATLAALSGLSRAALERGSSPVTPGVLRREAATMLQAYLAASSTARSP